jgi:SPP1 gp7 family putative phage head morphogenesis protein
MADKKGSDENNRNRILLMRKKASRKKVFPINKINRVLENNYRKVLRNLTSQIERLVKLNLYPQIEQIDESDGQGAGIRAAEAFSKTQVEIIPTIESTMSYSQKIIEKMNLDNFAKFQKSMKETLGIEISDVIMSPDVQRQLQIITEANFNLIKSLPNEELQKIKTTVLSNLQQGRFESSEIKKALEPIFKSSSKRADLIARDQSHKINASLNKVRSQAVGITQYRWRNSNDLRVRGNPSGYYPDSRYNHWTREGKIYDYDDTKNPADGQPGMPINCRCYAEDVIPEIYKQ